MFRLFSRRPAKSPRYFSVDHFDRCIPVWEELLAEFKGRPNIAALEIGSLEGRSACWLLEHVLTGPGAHLVCVDTFSGNARPLAGAPALKLDRFRANVAPWRGRVHLRAGRSADVLRSLEGSFAFIYVDATHTASAVLSDAVLAWPHLKQHGLMIFDDYARKLPDEPHGNVKLGADSFLACQPGQFAVVHNGYQLAVRKTAN